MEKNKKRNIVILIILIMLIIIGLHAFTKSRASKIIKITANINDNGGLLNDEVTTLLATNEGENGVAIVLPSFINQKKIKKYMITKKEIIDESKTDADSINNTITNTASESVDNKIANNTSEKIIDTKTDNSISKENTSSEIKKEEIVEMKPGEKIYLTQEEIENEKITLKVEYDTLELEDKIFYNKKLVLYDDDENEKLAVSGYMPHDTEMKVEEVDLSNLEEQITQGYPNYLLIRRLSNKPYF